jgi:hypothetical protein
MSIEILNFNKLDFPAKMQLLQKNQNLLIKYHPNSDFIIRTNQKIDAIYKYYVNLIQKYQGKVASSEDFMLFFHIMQINNPEDVSEYAIKRAEGDFDENGNCCFVEYIVGKYSAKDLALLKSHFEDTKVEFVSYVKHERVNSVSFAKLKDRILKNAKG